MKLSGSDPLKRLLSLAFGASRAPAGAFRISIALFYGVVCHSVFIAAVLAMIVAMFFGMSKSLGTIPQPWSIIVNIFLILQFPIAHSLLLSKRGTFVLAKLAPAVFAPTLATTTYAIIASIQLFMLFALWTPSGIIWWQAEGFVFFGVCFLYLVSWL